MKKGIWNIWLMLLVCLALMCQASATIVTFDDITTDPVTMLPIPDNYEGFNWVNFFIMDPAARDDPSGYPNGLVSGEYIAWSCGPTDISEASIAITSGDNFDFTGVYLTAAWRDDLNITVEGHFDNELVYSQTVVINPYGPTWFTFNFTNVDELRFIPIFSSGTPVPGFSGNGLHFVLDNFTFVPEPATVLLLGLGGLALLRKRRA